MIVVTGGAGFIGSALIYQLNEVGIFNILVVDQLDSDEKWKNLSGLQFSNYLEKEHFLESIIYSDDDLDIDVILHMGAISSTTEENMSLLVENNFEYTKKLALFSIKHDIRFIYASSAATYGSGDMGYSDDNEQILSLRPLNKYGFSKQLFDMYAYHFDLLDKIVGLKFFNVFGPNEYHKGSMRSMVFKAFEQIRDTGKVKLFKSYKKDYKNGEQKRDFVYIKDVVNMILFFLDNDKTGIYNIGTGKARTWNDLAKAVFKAMNKPVKIEYIDMPEEIKNQYQYFTQADISKIRNAGYREPITSLEDAVQDYVKYYLLNGNLFLGGEE